MRRILLISLSLILVINYGLAQNTLTYAQKSEMVVSSNMIELDAEILQLADQYASQNNYDIIIFQKNYIHLKVIYNNELAVANRIAYCDYLLDLWENDNSCLPKPIILKQKKTLRELNSIDND